MNEIKSRQSGRSASGLEVPAATLQTLADTRHAAQQSSQMRQSSENDSAQQQITKHMQMLLRQSGGRH